MRSSKKPFSNWWELLQGASPDKLRALGYLVVMLTLAIAIIASLIISAHRGIGTPTVALWSVVAMFLGKQANNRR
jgi:hypothetical protein